MPPPAPGPAPVPATTGTGPPPTTSSLPIAPIQIPGVNFANPYNPFQSGAMTRSERAALPPFDRERLRQKAVEPLLPYFDTKGELLKQDNQGVDFLTNSLDFQKQVKNLKERLTTYCMHDVFTLYPINLATGLPSSSTTTNLLDDYSNITQDLILANSNMYFGYGDKVAGENLLWSKTLILASSAPDLRIQIETQMASLPPQHDTGITAFFFLASFVISTSDQVARAIVLKLSTMRLSNFPGEDVPLMVATVRGAASRLQTCNRLPLDMNDIVIDILDSASNF